MLITLIGLMRFPSAFFAVIIAFISALFLCMPFHEFAHAHAAYKEGDMTAKVLGRYTLAPFKHIDIKGLLLLLVFGIGYAKPVPVDERNFKRGTKSKLRVAFAGVLVNLLIGVIACFLYCFLNRFWPALFTSYGFLGDIYYYFFNFVISLNFMFAFFNILPIYPLDGFRVVESLAGPYNKYVEFMKAYGFWIMIALLFTSIFDIYINFFAGGLSGLIIKGFDAFFALF